MAAPPVPNFDDVDLDALPSLMSPGVSRGDSFRSDAGGYGSDISFDAAATNAVAALAAFTDEELLAMGVADLPSPSLSAQVPVPPNGGSLTGLSTTAVHPDYFTVPSGDMLPVARTLSNGSNVLPVPGTSPSPGPTPGLLPRTPSKRKRDMKGVEIPAFSLGGQSPLASTASPSLRAAELSGRQSSARKTPCSSPALVPNGSYRSPVLSPKPAPPPIAATSRRGTPVASQPPPLSLSRAASSRPASVASVQSHSTVGTPLPSSAVPGTPTASGSAAPTSAFDDFTVCSLCRAGYKNGDKWRNVRRIHIHWYMLMESGALCNPETKEPIHLLSEWQDKEPYKAWAKSKDQRVSSHFKVFTHEQLAHAFSAKSTAMPVHKHCLHAFNFVVKARFDDLVKRTGYSNGPHPDEFGSTYSKRDMDAELMFDPDSKTPMYVLNKKCYMRRRNRGPSKRTRHHTKSGSGASNSRGSMDSSSHWSTATHSTITSNRQGLPPRRPTSALASPVGADGFSTRTRSTDGDADMEARAVALGLDSLAIGSRSTRAQRRSNGGLSSPRPPPVPPALPTVPSDAPTDFSFPFPDLYPLQSGLQELELGSASYTHVSSVPVSSYNVSDFFSPSVGMPAHTRERILSDDIFRGSHFSVHGDDLTEMYGLSDSRPRAEVVQIPTTGDVAMPSMLKPEGGEGLASIPPAVAEGDEDEDAESDEEGLEGGDDDRFLPGTSFAPYNFSDNIALSVATL